jgi:hypothetical protein
MVDAASPFPSVDALLRTPEAEVLAARFGRAETLAAIRGILAAFRAGSSTTRPTIWRAGPPNPSARCST